MGRLLYDEPEAGPPVATDQDADGDNFQVIKLAFGAGGSPADVERVERSVPLPARDYHGGSVPFDTGRVPLTDAFAFITDEADVWVDAILLVNLTSEVQAFSLENGADEEYGGRDLDPREMRPVPLFGFLFAGGIKMKADVNGAVVVQIKGVQ